MSEFLAFLEIFARVVAWILELVVHLICLALLLASFCCVWRIPFIIQVLLDVESKGDFWKCSISQFFLSLFAIFTVALGLVSLVGFWRWVPLVRKLVEGDECLGAERDTRFSFDFYLYFALNFFLVFFDLLAVLPLTILGLVLHPVGVVSCIVEGVRESPSSSFREYYNFEPRQGVMHYGLLTLLDVFIVPAFLLSILSWRAPLLLRDIREASGGKSLCDAACVRSENPTRPWQDSRETIEVRLAIVKHGANWIIDLPFVVLALVGLASLWRTLPVIRLLRSPPVGESLRWRLTLQVVLLLRDLFFFGVFLILVGTLRRALEAVLAVVSIFGGAPSPKRVPGVQVTRVGLAFPKPDVLQLRLHFTKPAGTAFTEPSSSRLHVVGSDPFWSRFSEVAGSSVASLARTMLPLRLARNYVEADDWTAGLGNPAAQEGVLPMSFPLGMKRTTLEKKLRRLAPEPIIAQVEHAGVAVLVALIQPDVMADAVRAGGADDLLGPVPMHPDEVERRRSLALAGVVAGDPAAPAAPAAPAGSAAGGGAPCPQDRFWLALLPPLGQLALDVFHLLLLALTVLAPWRFLILLVALMEPVNLWAVHVRAKVMRMTRSLAVYQGDYREAFLSQMQRAVRTVGEGCVPSQADLPRGVDLPPEYADDGVHGTRGHKLADRESDAFRGKGQSLVLAALQDERDTEAAPARRGLYDLFAAGLKKELLAQDTSAPEPEHDDARTALLDEVGRHVLDQESSPLEVPSSGVVQLRNRPRQRPVRLAALDARQPRVPVVGRPSSPSGGPDERAARVTRVIQPSGPGAVADSGSGAPGATAPVDAGGAGTATRAAGDDSFNVASLLEPSTAPEDNEAAAAEFDAPDIKEDAVLPGTLAAEADAAEAASGPYPPEARVTAEAAEKAPATGWQSCTAIYDRLVREHQWQQRCLLLMAAVVAGWRSGSLSSDTMDSLLDKAAASEHEAACRAEKAAAMAESRAAELEARAWVAFSVSPLNVFRRSTADNRTIVRSMLTSALLDVLTIAGGLLVLVTWYRAADTLAAVRRAPVWEWRRIEVLAAALEVVKDLFAVLGFLVLLVTLYRAIDVLLDIAASSGSLRSTRDWRRPVWKYLRRLGKDLIKLLNVVLAWRAFKFVLATVCWGLLVPPAGLSELLAPLISGKFWRRLLAGLVYTSLIAYPFVLSYVIVPSLRSAGGFDDPQFTSDDVRRVRGAVAAFLGGLCLAALGAAVNGARHADLGRVSGPSRVVSLTWPNVMAAFSLVFDCIQLWGLPWSALSFASGADAAGAVDQGDPISEKVSEVSERFLFVRAGTFYQVYIVSLCAVGAWYLLTALPAVVENFFRWRPHGFFARSEAWRSLVYTLGNHFYLAVTLNLMRTVQCDYESGTGPLLRGTMLPDPDRQCWNRAHSDMVAGGLFAAAVFVSFAHFFSAESGLARAHADDPRLDIRFAPAYESASDTVRLIGGAAVVVFATDPYASLGAMMVLGVALAALSAGFARLSGGAPSCPVPWVRYVRTATGLGLAFSAAMAAAEQAARDGKSGSSSSWPSKALLSGLGLLVLATLVRSLVAARRVRPRVGPKLQEAASGLLRLEQELAAAGAFRPEWSAADSKERLAWRARAEKSKSRKRCLPREVAALASELEAAVSADRLRLTFLGNRVTWRWAQTQACPEGRAALRVLAGALGWKVEDGLGGAADAARRAAADAETTEEPPPDQQGTAPVLPRPQTGGASAGDWRRGETAEMAMTLTVVEDPTATPGPKEADPPAGPASASRAGPDDLVRPSWELPDQNSGVVEEDDVWLVVGCLVAAIRRPAPVLYEVANTLDARLTSTPSVAESVACAQYAADMVMMSAPDGAGPAENEAESPGQHDPVEFWSSARGEAVRLVPRGRLRLPVPTEGRPEEAGGGRESRRAYPAASFVPFKDRR